MAIFMFVIAIILAYFNCDVSFIFFLISGLLAIKEIIVTECHNEKNFRKPLDKQQKM